MNSLLFSDDDDDIQSVIIESDRSDHFDEIRKFFEDNITINKQYFEDTLFLEDSLFFRMPYSLKRKDLYFCEVIYSVIDHAIALAEAWGMEGISNENIINVALTRSLAIVGVNCKPRYYQKKLKRTFRWQKNLDTDASIEWHQTIHTVASGKIKLTPEEITGVLGSSYDKSELGFIIDTALKYNEHYILGK